MMYEHLFYLDILTPSQWACIDRCRHEELFNIHLLNTKALLTLDNQINGQVINSISDYVKELENYILDTLDNMQVR